MHLDLSTSAQSVAGATPSRSFAMIAPDPTTVVDIYAADYAGASGSTSGALIKELTQKTPKVELTDSSTFVYYVVKQGSAPTAIWMDAPDAVSPGLAGPAWAVVGPVNVSYAPVAGELVLVSPPSGGVQVTLPSAGGVMGQRVGIKDTGAASTLSPITVTTVSGQTLDGSSSTQITAGHGHLVCVSDGSNWWNV